MHSKDCLKLFISSVPSWKKENLFSVAPVHHCCKCPLLSPLQAEHHLNPKADVSRFNLSRCVLFHTVLLLTKVLRHTPLMSFISLQPRLAWTYFLNAIGRQLGLIIPALWLLWTPAKTFFLLSIKSSSASEVRGARLYGPAPYRCGWKAHSSKNIPVSCFGIQLLLESEATLWLFLHLRPEQREDKSPLFSFTKTQYQCRISASCLNYVTIPFMWSVLGSMFVYKHGIIVWVWKCLVCALEAVWSENRGMVSYVYICLEKGSICVSSLEPELCHYSVICVVSRCTGAGLGMCFPPSKEHQLICFCFVPQKS